MIEVAYIQHSGKQYCSQQDALRNSEACVQARNAPTVAYCPAEGSLLLAVDDGVSHQSFSASSQPIHS